MNASHLKLFRFTLVFILGLMFGVSSFGQAPDTLRNVMRPRIGLGTGVMTYYGEVQNYQKQFAPTVNRFGGTIYANAPVTRMFNVEFTASYSKIAANERTLKRNYNFESRIRMGSAILYYNFYPLFQPKRQYFHPFIGTGIASFEFLSKTDLYDANGNQYFYWSDGSIMNMDENDPLAPTTAEALVRDYTYETNLRELNIDDLGKYREQSFAIPLSLGAEWHISPRWDFRVATTYYFTFTDLIDNVSPAGTGIRKGDEGFDRLLFTSVGLSYDLKIKRQAAGDTTLMDEEGIPLFAYFDPNDFDKDGVIDALDKCPATPLEALVDTSGCPLDGDKDGVPDYRDDEPNTPLDNFVDEFGVTITEDDIANHLRLYYDSTGYEHEFEEYRTEVILNREGHVSIKRPDRKREGLKYVIVVGKEMKDVTVNDLHKYLGYNEYSTITKGDTVYYTLGTFNSIEEAVAAKAGLEDEGVKVDEIGRNSGNGETILTVDNEVIEKVERVNIEEGREGPEYSNPKQLFRVQLGAFSKKVDTEELFPGLDVVYGASEKDGLNRYYTSSFETFEEASAYQKDLRRKGFNNTFVIAYETHERVTLVEAGVDENKLPDGYTEEQELETFVDERTPVNNEENSDYTINLDKVKYRVQLAQFKGDIPVETVDILYNIKNIKPVKDREGTTTYYSQSFDSEEERDASMEEYKSYGLAELIPVMEYDSIIYTVKEFNKKFKK